MARGPSTFRQQDVTRALRATLAAGVEVSTIEIDKTGKILISVETGKGEQPDNLTPLEAWRRKRHAR